MQTIKEICDEIYKVDEAGRPPVRNVEPIPVTRGLVVRDAPKKQGLFQITPEQALSIYIERVSINGTIEGYQREQDITRCRRIARDLIDGEDVGEISVALDSGRLFVDEGAHRLIAAVIARKPIWIVVRRRDYVARKKRFASQTKQRRISSDVLALTYDSSIHRYIQAAVIARKNGGEHPWAKLVGAKNTGAVMGPQLAVSALVNYTLAIRGANLQRLDDKRVNAEFRPEFGEQMARMLLAFGTKGTNPLAFRPVAIRAIADASAVIIAKRGRQEQDITRWERHMSTFDWPGYAWVRSSRELTRVLIAHWNKRLSGGRKVDPGA